eukprot:4554164-Amphidinium_carterae.2
MGPRFIGPSVMKLPPFCEAWKRHGRQWDEDRLVSGVQIVAASYWDGKGAFIQAGSQRCADTDGS